MKKSRPERGQAVVETAFLVPWIFFLFVGLLDLGFYCFALMATSNAARMAAVQLSPVYVTPTVIQPEACTIVLAEMQSLPNLYQVSTACKAAPLTVIASCFDYTTGSGSTSACPSCGSASENCSNQVTVTYTTVPLIPIPGILPNQFVFNQKAEVRFGG